MFDNSVAKNAETTLVYSLFDTPHFTKRWNNTCLFTPCAATRQVWFLETLKWHMSTHSIRCNETSLVTWNAETRHVYSIHMCITHVYLTCVLHMCITRVSFQHRHLSRFSPPSLQTSSISAKARLELVSFQLCLFHYLSRFSGKRVSYQLSISVN